MPCSYSQYLGIRVLPTYSAHPDDVYGSFSSSCTLTRYVTGSIERRSVALRCMMAALSFSVGCAATTCTALTFGGTGGCMFLPPDQVENCRSPTKTTPAGRRSNTNE